jgi:hypothetical protein
MQNVTRLTFAGTFLGIVTVLAGWFLALPLQLNAQNNTCSGTQGQNGVYNATCNNGNPGVVGSSAFIDASMFPATGRDFCGVLKFILSSSTYPPAGAVIDARGLPGTTQTSMTCTASPWAGITNPPPSTILLPATTGAAPIVIPSTWSLPPNTHLIGEGDGTSPWGFTPGTTLLAQSSFTAGTPMISFGQSSRCTSGCTGISVENLTLDGQGQSIDGIDNGFSQDSSYADHVGLYRILGTGLSVSGTANNSGPYSNINFDLGGDSGTSSTICASINGLSRTRGIHGLSCISESNVPPAAVLLDSSNNSIEDVRIVGFYDGIRVGANANALSNVLINIIGDTTAMGPTPIIVVHIFSSHTVSDLSIMGANNAGGSNGTITLKDEVTGAQLTDTSVGIYALGESASGGYSRFTTSPNAPTWAVGTGFPSNNTACTRGSLYSCIGGSTSCNSAALWACALSGGTAKWLAVK